MQHVEHVQWPPKRLSASTLQKQHQFLIVEVTLLGRPEVRTAEDHRRKQVCQVQQSGCPMCYRVWLNPFSRGGGGGGDESP